MGSPHSRTTDLPVSRRCPFLTPRSPAKLRVERVYRFRTMRPEILLRTWQLVRRVQWPTRLLGPQVPHPTFVTWSEPRLALARAISDLLEPAPAIPLTSSKPIHLRKAPALGIRALWKRQPTPTTTASRLISGSVHGMVCNSMLTIPGATRSESARKTIGKGKEHCSHFGTCD